MFFLVTSGIVAALTWMATKAQPTPTQPMIAQVAHQPAIPPPAESAKPVTATYWDNGKYIEVDYSRQFNATNPVTEMGPITMGFFPHEHEHHNARNKEATEKYNDKSHLSSPVPH